MALSEYYVDASLGSDTGDGSSGTPWGRASGSVVQYALDNITRNATDGDRINVKAGTDDVLSAALDFSTYNATGGTSGAPLIIQGYTTSAGDGGQGSISGGGSVAVVNNSADYTQFIDLKLFNCGSADIVTVDDFCKFIRCEITGTSGAGLATTGSDGCIIESCYFYSLGSGVGARSQTVIRGCVFNDLATSITVSQSLGQMITGNCFYCTSTANGIDVTNGNGTWRIVGNSFYSTGSGDAISASGEQIESITDNAFEGWANAIVAGKVNLVARNVYYDNSTANNAATETYASYSNTAASGALFAKSGSPTLANAATYFAPTSELEDAGLFGAAAGAIPATGGGGGSVNGGYVALV